MPYYRHKHEQTSAGKQYFNGKSDKAATSVSIGDVLCPALMVCAIAYLIIGLCSLPVTLGHLPRARACQLAALALLGATNLVWQLLTSLRHQLQLGSSASLVPTRKCFNLQFTTSAPRRSEEEETQCTAKVKISHVFEPIFKRFDYIHNALAACFSRSGGARIGQ
ncbi:hypothetical protein AC578_3130 [Pseudocercospora eumusae]|uniref:Uncharacterized protein n=1 Tax=Pseudocercospora eumusae TaxID=321146 RepID=A0A139H669_9PEZI|nr:hypothetical protein AC578_3130 [Pseudocercospora eumusae]